MAGKGRSGKEDAIKRESNKRERQGKGKERKGFLQFQYKMRKAVKRWETGKGGGKERGRQLERKAKK